MKRDASRIAVLAPMTGHSGNHFAEWLVANRRRRPRPLKLLLAVVGMSLWHGVAVAQVDAQVEAGRALPDAGLAMAGDASPETIAAPPTIATLLEQA